MSNNMVIVGFESYTDVAQSLISAQKRTLHFNYPFGKINSWVNNQQTPLYITVISHFKDKE